jgi:hypothetical protein
MGSRVVRVFSAYQSTPPSSGLRKANSSKRSTVATARDMTAAIPAFSTGLERDGEAVRCQVAGPRFPYKILVAEAPTEVALQK